MAKLMIEMGGVTQELECSEESMAACVLATAGETDPAKVGQSVPLSLLWIQGAMEAAGVGYAETLQTQAAKAQVARAVEIKRLEGRASVRINGVPAFPEAQAQLDALLAEGGDE